MSRLACLTAVIIACLLAQPVTASTVHPNLDASAIRTQQQEIRAEAAQRRGRYKDLEEPRRAELFRHQSKVDSLLKSVDKTTDLSELEQVQLFNSLEAIEAIVNAAEDDRMICERSKPVGSNRPVTVCKTVAQRREERESSTRDMGRRTLECSEATMGPGGCLR
jgi:hypothetical protein